MHTLIVDGSALFFAIRDIFGDSQLDYLQLVTHIEKAVGEKIDVKIFYTAHSPANAGQGRFLVYLKDTGWIVRTQHASNVGLVDQRTMAMVSGPVKDRLTRFDPQIAYAVGDHASQENGVTVVTDSFGLAEPLVRAQRISNHNTYIAFFSTALDPRWSMIKGVGRIDLDGLVPSGSSDEFIFPPDEGGE